MKRNFKKIVLAGLAGGFLGNGVLGAAFSLPAIRSILYDPAIQSKLYLEIIPLRNIPVSVGGLVALSVVHSSLLSVFAPSIPGRSWLRKGLFWSWPSSLPAHWWRVW